MKVAFIGAGKMAEAIIASLIHSKTVEAHEVCACDISADRRRLLKRRYGINMYSKNNMAGTSDIIFLAVKPQNLDEVIGSMAADITKKQIVVSILAGKKISTIEKALPRAKVIRVMPNLPATVMEGMSVYCAGSKATAGDRKMVAGLLACFGKVLELPENDFDAVTALSGSGPAFFAYLMNAMVESAVGLGMTRKDALLLAEQTMLGTSRLLVEKKVDPVDLIRSVASAKGTTEAGLKILEKSTIVDILDKTIKAAAKRSEELSS